MWSPTLRNDGEGRRRWVQGNGWNRPSHERSRPSGPPAYHKAKNSPNYRFYALYDKIYRRDVLGFAYERCRANRGAPGVDGQSFADIEEYGVVRWLDELAEEVDRLFRAGYTEVVDADLSGYFDSIPHAELIKSVSRRISDGRVLRLLKMWLETPVEETDAEGNRHRTTRNKDQGMGTQQGAPVSPMLSNIFLHYVLDEWFEREVQPRLKGRSFLIRYADDFVMGFSREGDARRVLAVLPKRFAKYGLTIHPDKTRLVPFERPDRGPKPTDGNRREPPGTFDLLGFTHFWSRSRNGNWVVKQKTSDSRFSRGLKSISLWCRSNRHHPMAAQHRTLCQKLRGHFAYYGITGNSVALSRFRRFVTGIWRKWLSRRRRQGTIPWDEFHRLMGRYPLPPPVAIHSVCRPAASS